MMMMNRSRKKLKHNAWRGRGKSNEWERKGYEVEEKRLKTRKKKCVEIPFLG